MEIIEQLVEEFDLAVDKLKNTLKLFDNDYSLHFIARYRKNITGGLDPEILDQLYSRYSFLLKLKEMKTSAIEKLNSQDITDEYLLSAIKASGTISDIKEILSPYVSKRESKANKARNLGLQPVADIILGKVDSEMDSILKNLSISSPLDQCKPIIAEETINHPRMKRIAEEYLLNSQFTIKYRAEQDTEGKYSDLLNLSGKVRDLSPHQIMAIFRARDVGVIRFQFKIKKKQLLNELRSQILFKPNKKYLHIFDDGLREGITRLLLPRAKRAVLRNLKENADQRAIEVFKSNLQHLLLQPPIIPKVVLAIDPGYVNGCKIAVVDKLGGYLASRTIYPTPPKNQTRSSKETLYKIVGDYDVEFIAIGNGTASTETINFVREFLEESNLYDIEFALVPETGASVYSASEVARSELPNVDVSERGAVSIARRILDPLNELVKIDPKSLGIGQYQHDVNQNKLRDALEFITKKCVNRNGVYINNASMSVLSYIAGLNTSLANRIVEYHRNYGFTEIIDLYNVSGIGEKTFEEAAGFIRMAESKNLLDMTLIHPHHYDFAMNLIDSTGKNVFAWNELLIDEREILLANISLDVLMQEYDIDQITTDDIVNELIMFGQDPRGIKDFVDLSTSPESIAELDVDMVLMGEVRNVVDFGCFVDLGIKENGLVHISKMADRYITSPHSIVRVGDQVRVRVLEIDMSRKRISLELLEVNGQNP